MVSRFSPKAYLPYLQVIQGAIEEFQKKNETFKLASKELNVEEPVSLNKKFTGQNRIRRRLCVFKPASARICFYRERNLVDEPLVGSGTTR